MRVFLSRLVVEHELLGVQQGPEDVLKPLSNLHLALRRLGDQWLVELEVRAWHDIDERDSLASLRRDDYVGLTLFRYF